MYSIGAKIFFSHTHSNCCFFFAPKFIQCYIFRYFAVLRKHKTNLFRDFKNGYFFFSLSQFNIAFATDDAYFNSIQANIWNNIVYYNFVTVVCRFFGGGGARCPSATGRRPNYLGFPLLVPTESYWNPNRKTEIDSIRSDDTLPRCIFQLGLRSIGSRNVQYRVRTQRVFYTRVSACKTRRVSTR